MVTRRGEPPPTVHHCVALPSCPGGPGPCAAGDRQRDEPCCTEYVDPWTGKILARDMGMRQLPLPQHPPRPTVEYPTTFDIAAQWAVFVCLALIASMFGLEICRRVRARRK